MPGKTQIVWTSNTIPKRLRELAPRIDDGVAAIMEYHAPRVQSSARQNASWTDRTSNARNGLMAETYQGNKVRGIVLHHSVPYGIWLEVRFSGRYAIIEPTIQKMAPEVMNSVRKLLERIG